MVANSQKGLAYLKSQIKALPHNAGVYRMIDKKGKVLYVGKAKNIKRRVINYTRYDALPNRLKRMVSATYQLEIITTNSEQEALLLEANLIKKLKPAYNIVFRDDKSLPYILVTKNEDFPKLIKHRGAKKQAGHYFGPFASNYAVNNTIIALQRAFLLRSCSDSIFTNRSRPCMLYQIKRCTAPCVQKITAPSYKELVKQSLEFLSGKSNIIQKNFATEMQQASDSLNFEKAVIYRDRIRALSTIQAQQDINLQDVGDIDIFALYKKEEKCCIQVFFYRAGRNYGNIPFFPSHTNTEMEDQDILCSFILQFYQGRQIPKNILLSHNIEDKEIYEKALEIIANKKICISYPKKGKKKKLIQNAINNAKITLGRKIEEQSTFIDRLSQTANLLKIPNEIQRVEVYDNSHISGSDAYGVMIVATPEGFAKQHYRKFKIKAEEGLSKGDDFGMMRQVFYRRFSKALQEDSIILPDLIIIDGGKGQLSSAKSILQNLGLSDIPVIAMSKGPDRNAGREQIHLPSGDVFQLNPKDPILYFLQRLRDESHRFAIGTHRQKREKSIAHSRLDDIDGIGRKRKQNLLHFFGSTKAIENAGIEDLQMVDNISKALAQKIYNFFLDI